MLFIRYSRHDKSNFAFISQLYFFPARHIFFYWEFRKFLLFQPFLKEFNHEEFLSLQSDRFKLNVAFSGGKLELWRESKDV
ncbi:MAG: hypothetical protein DMG06_22100 [Acidobacteria bacterium]|nr:MAG: hypothetical protein DMG06_22100 [Acidobacteriota bacterium]